MLLLSFALAKTYNQQERYVRRTSIFPFIYRRLMSRYKIFIDLSFLPEKIEEQDPSRRIFSYQTNEENVD